MVWACAMGMMGGAGSAALGPRRVGGKDERRHLALLGHCYCLCRMEGYLLRSLRPADP